MICPKCGANTSESDNYCEDCGASLKIKSPVENAPVDCKRASKSDVVAVDSFLAEATNVGRKHPKNEDYGTVMRCQNGAVIMVVSDGVSSAVNAVSASVQAVDKVKEVLDVAGDGSNMDLIKTAINEANDLVVKLPYETRADGIYGPEATIVTALVRDDTVTFGWVGDSRAYIIGKTAQKLLTTDDSWVELVVSSGEMQRSQAAADKRAHYVTQVLGMHDQTMDIHTLEHKIEKGQILLLCSDGLWNYLQGENDLFKAIADFGMEKDAIAICEHLIGLANNAGGHDNITVAIYKNF